MGKEAEAGEPAKYQGNPDTILLARRLRLCKALRYNDEKPGDYRAKIGRFRHSNRDVSQQSIQEVAKVTRKYNRRELTEGLRWCCAGGLYFFCCILCRVGC